MPRRSTRQTLHIAAQILTNRAYAIHRKFSGSYRALPPEIQKLQFASLAMQKLLLDYEFDSVLDVGAGAGHHSQILRDAGKNVTALDFGKSIYYEKKETDINFIIADFMSLDDSRKYDCVWASHVLEHQPDPGLFIKKLYNLLNSDGVLAITVPPLKHSVVGGHLTLWNAGILLYQLAFNGFDCRGAAVRSYGYNVSVILKKSPRGDLALDYDSGDIDRLSEYLPPFCKEGFDGRISKWNW